MTRRSTLVAVLLPLLLLAAGCGDDDDDDAAAAADTVDCHVTVDEASSAVGLPLEESQTAFPDDGVGETCSWEYTFEDATATVDVTWFEGTGADAMEDAGAAYSDAEAVDVQGADEAVYSAENSAVVARAGDDAVRVFVVGPDIILDDPKGAAITIAEVAFGLATEGE